MANIKFSKFLLTLLLLLLICLFELGLCGDFNRTYFRYCDGKDDYEIKVQSVNFWPLQADDATPWTLNITASLPIGKPFSCSGLVYKMLVREKSNRGGTVGQGLLCKMIDIQKSSSTFVLYGRGGVAGKENVPKSMMMWIEEEPSVRNLTCILMGEWAQNSRPRLS